jgi:CRISPR-associated protein Csb2
MLAISVDLLHGTFRGASADDTALTGAGEDSGEWPPSPARLFAALVAADGTGDRQRVTDGSELLVLERAQPPSILADASDRVELCSLRDRFVVSDEFHRDAKTRLTGTVHEYVGRTAVVVRPGTRRAPATSRIVFIWSDLKVSPGQLGGLRARAARIGYLGCADSPVRVHVHTRWEAEASDPPLWEPDAAGAAVLPVPWPGFLNTLNDAYERWSGGEVMRRAWLPSRLARYRRPGDPEPAGPEPTVVWLRYSPSISGRRVVAVTETLRAAVLEGYERLVAGSADLVPRVLHGHGYQGRGYQHAHWLALPHVDYRWASGAILGGAVWLPPGTEPEIAEGVRQVLWDLSTRTLVCPGRFETKVSLFAGEKRPVAATPDRWVGPSARWASAFPVVHERWQAGGPDLAEVARWCRNAGISVPPISAVTSRVPFIPGAVSLRPQEVARSNRERRPYSHLNVVFAEPVGGPVALGRGRQFGLGLMAPLRPRGGPRA